MGALKLLEQVSESSPKANRNKTLDGALRDFSLEFRQFVIGESNNSPPDGDDPFDIFGARRKFENEGNNKGCHKGNKRPAGKSGSYSLLMTGDDKRKILPIGSEDDLPCRQSRKSSLDEMRLHKWQSDVVDLIIAAPSRVPKPAGSCDRREPLVASARTMQLTFVKPDTADCQYSMMRLPPPLIPTASDGMKLFGGKVDVFLLKNAGSLKVRFSTVLSSILRIVSLGNCIIEAESNDTGYHVSVVNCRSRALWCWMA